MVLLFDLHNRCEDSIVASTSVFFFKMRKLRISGSYITCLGSVATKWQSKVLVQVIQDYFLSEKVWTPMLVPTAFSYTRMYTILFSDWEFIFFSIRPFSVF